MLAALLAFLLVTGSPAGSPAPSASASPAPSPTSYKPLTIPTPGATPWSTLSLAGVTLAETPDQVRARLGEPFLTNLKPEVQVWTYPMDANHVALSVFIRRGRVIGIATALSGTAKKSLFADPFGVHLGDGIDTLLSTRGQTSNVANRRNMYAAGPAFEWEYEFDRGIVASIALNAKSAISGPLPNAIPRARSHDGSSADLAIRFKVSNERDALLYETTYLGLARCDGQGTWTPTNKSALADPRTRSLIIVYAVDCSTTGRQAKFYFDHSNIRQR